MNFRLKQKIVLKKDQKTSFEDNSGDIGIYIEEGKFINEILI